MLLPELLKKIYELPLCLRDNGGARIEDVCSVQDDTYGYALVLTSFKGNIYDEVIAAKLAGLGGRKILPDLWLFGPCTKEKSSEEKNEDQI